MRTTLATLVLLLLLACPGCRTIRPAEAQTTPQRFEYARILMGVKARVVLYADDEPTAAAAATRAFERIDRLDEVMSDYRPDSELARLITQPAGEWLAVSDDLFGVIERARNVSRASGGAFDVTIGPLVRLWREAGRTGERPDQLALGEALRRTGYRHIQLDPRNRRVRFAEPGVRIDLGGIGKGYAAQEALRALADAGHPVSMVDLGGDLALGRPPPGRGGWSIRVQNTLETDRTLTLAETCVATSGDAEQTAVIEGTRYAHIIDPRTGEPLTTPRAATVIHPDGATADALASAACVLGPDAVARLRDAFPRARIFIAEGEARH
jgi:thiamine biosynthesis lipoprotein